MGSSCPASREGQSSRRKEISRLSESKRKTIAFFKRWSFCLQKGRFMKTYFVFFLFDALLFTVYLLLLVRQTAYKILGKARSHGAS
jgi:hypothetical protein